MTRRWIENRQQKPWALRATVTIAALTLLGATFASRGTAEELRSAPEERGGPAWRGHVVEHGRPGDCHSVHERDLGRWRAGHWVRGEHAGRFGWWWVADGSWFFYAGPIYPYPDPYVPPAVMGEAAPPEEPTYWYYCESLKAYYPWWFPRRPPDRTSRMVSRWPRALWQLERGGLDPVEGKH